MSPRRTPPPAATIRHDADANPAEAARKLASLAARLWPNWRDPERFHQDKSDLTTGLRRLAARLDRQAR